MTKVRKIKSCKNLTPCFIIQEYSKALKYVKRLLAIEPNNHQAKDLENAIEKKMKSGMLKALMDVYFNIGFIRVRK